MGLDQLQFSAGSWKVLMDYAQDSLLLADAVVDAATPFDYSRVVCEAVD